MTGTDADERAARRRRRLRRLVIAGLSLVGLVVLVSLSDFSAELQRLVERVEELGAWAPVLFVLLHAAAVITLVPGILFPLGAGFLFGWGLGSLLSVLGKTIGSAVSFLIARYLLQGFFPHWSERFRDGHPVFRRLLEGLPKGGWTTVLQIRLVPIIPFKLSSYLFGWTEFRFRDYVLGTLLATVPFSMLNAYLGSLGADLTQFGQRPVPDTPLEWALYTAGVLISIAACTLLVRRGRAILKRNSKRSRS